MVCQADEGERGGREKKIAAKEEITRRRRRLLVDFRRPRFWSFVSRRPATGCGAPVVIVRPSFFFSLFILFTVDCTRRDDAHNIILFWNRMRAKRPDFYALYASQSLKGVAISRNPDYRIPVLGRRARICACLSLIIKKRRKKHLRVSKMPIVSDSLVIRSSMIFSGDSAIPLTALR